MRSCWTPHSLTERTGQPQMHCSPVSSCFATCATAPATASGRALATYRNPGDISGDSKRARAAKLSTLSICLASASKVSTTLTGAAGAAGAWATIRTR
eukprot:7387216-Prymnesium_polylepis.1